jgi:hypothetical protein
MRLLGYDKLAHHLESVEQSSGWGLALISTATLLAVLGCSSAERTTDPSLAQGENAPITRPLTGRCETDVTIVSIGADGRLDLLDEYTCEMSHLGRTHNTVVQSVIPSGPPTGGLLPGIVTNTGAFVGANGDRVNSSFTGTGVTNLVNFTATFEGTETFVGGTGRFADASGTAHIQGTAVLDPTTGTGKGQFTIVGTITY